MPIFLYNARVLEALKPLGGYVYLMCTVLLTIYGQIVMKWQIGKVGATPHGTGEKVAFLLTMLLKPWVLSSFLAALLASFCWMLTLTRLPLGTAYPFTSLTFVGVILSGAVLFGESVSWPQVAGMGFLAVGIVLLGQR